MAKASRPASESRVEMTQIVLPQFANAHGSVFGGQVVSWIDICAAVAAQRHCRGAVVTASIDAVHFLEAIHQGDVVILRGQVNAAFRTSVECGVRVESESARTGERRHAVSAYCTFVAVDDESRPREIAPLKLETEEEQRRFEKATERRRQRLENRSRP